MPEIDDPTILDGAAIWRRIPHWHLIPNGNTGRIEMSSQAFDNDPDGGPMSAVLGDDLLGSGRKPESVLIDIGFALATFQAGMARGKGQFFRRDPTISEPFHALVVGNKTAPVRRTLRDAATWVIPPSPATLSEQQLDELEKRGLVYAPTLGRFVAYFRPDV